MSTLHKLHKPRLSAKEMVMEDYRGYLSGYSFMFRVSLTIIVLLAGGTIISVGSLSPEAVHTLWILYGLDILAFTIVISVSTMFLDFFKEEAPSDREFITFVAGFMGVVGIAEAAFLHGKFRLGPEIDSVFIFYAIHALLLVVSGVFTAIVIDDGNLVESLPKWMTITAVIWLAGILSAVV